MIEAQVIIDQATGEVSQSFQVAPYDDYYQFYNTTSAYYTQYNTSITSWNSYLGGYYQQAVSSLTTVPSDIYYSQDSVGGTSKDFVTFGFEYSTDTSDRSNGYITWVSNGKKSWTMDAGIVGPNSKTEVGQRIIPEEPMALVSPNSTRLDSLEIVLSLRLLVSSRVSFSWISWMRIGADDVSDLQPGHGKLTKIKSVKANSRPGWQIVHSSGAGSASSTRVTPADRSRPVQQLPERRL
jgi:hypothetical protein